MFGLQKFYVGHVGPVPVYIGIEAAFMLVLVYLWTPHAWGAAGYLIVLAALLIAILAHEMGHALVARINGMRGVTITIGALGGYCTYTGDRRPGKLLPIALAGIVVNFLLAWLCWILLPAVPLRNGGPGANLLPLLVGESFTTNLLLGIFNSLPVYPLDGGQAVLHAAQLVARRESTARRFTLTLTIITGIAALAWYAARNGGRLDSLPILLLLMFLMQAFQDLR